MTSLAPPELADTDDIDPAVDTGEHPTADANQ